MSPRARRPHPPDVRTHLLDAALRAFATWGYEGASVRKIAKEAGVAIGLLYHYFPSKEAVLHALFARSAGLVGEAFARAAHEREPAVRLGTLILASAQLVRDHQDFWRVSYGVRFQHAVVGGLAADIAAQSALLHGLFAELLAAMGRPEPETEARVLFATLDGLFQHFVLDAARYPLDDVVAHVIHTHGGRTASETT